MPASQILINYLLPRFISELFNFTYLCTYLVTYITSFTSQYTQKHDHTYHQTSQSTLCLRNKRQTEFRKTQITFTNSNKSYRCDSFVMHDRGNLSLYITSHPGQLSLAIPPCGDPLWLGSKGRYGLCVGGR